MRRKGSGKERDDDKKKLKTHKGAELKNPKKKEMIQVGLWTLDLMANFVTGGLFSTPLSSDFSFTRMILTLQRCQRGRWERLAQSRRRARGLLSQKKAGLCLTLSLLLLLPLLPRLLL